MADTESSQSNDQEIQQIATGDRAILPEGAKTIPVYVMGKKYEVPETLTIMKAMEYAGYQFIRGCGCRGGVCGELRGARSASPQAAGCTQAWQRRPAARGHHQAGRAHAR